jgi:hypothetical protein
MDSFIVQTAVMGPYLYFKTLFYKTIQTPVPKHWTRLRAYLMPLRSSKQSVEESFFLRRWYLLREIGDHGLYII